MKSPAHKPAEVCSAPQSLRCKAIEYREDVELCAALMAAAVELERLRGLALNLATDPFPDMAEYRAAAKRMIQGMR